MKKIILINAILISTTLIYADGKNTAEEITPNDGINLEENSSAPPIVVEGVSSSKELDKWIENYVTKNHPGYNIGDTEMDVSSKESIIETVYLKNEEGNVITIRLNITDYMRKFQQNNKKEILKISRALKKQKENVEKNKERGSSYNFPIDLKHAKTEQEVLEAQKDYLEKHFPDYQIVSRGIWVFGKKYIDRLRLEKEDHTKVLMFDVSSYINEYKKTYKIKLKEIAPGMISVEK